MTDSTVDNFVRASDEAAQFATAAIDGLVETAREDIDDLITNVEGRDAALWANLEVDAETTLDEIEEVPTTDRDLEWSIAAAGLFAASLAQFTLDNVEPLIVEPVAYRQQVLAPFELSRAQLISAGKRGAIGPGLIDVETFQALQAKHLRPLTYLTNLDPSLLYNTLLESRAIPNIDKLTTDAMGYVSRMTNYAEGTPQWKQAVADLVDLNSTRAIKGMSRRAIERINTMQEIDATGESDPLMVWLGEGGKNTCDFCIDRFGVVQRWSQWILDGLPGSEVCAGADLCKCQLHAA